MSKVSLIDQEMGIALRDSTANSPNNPIPAAAATGSQVDAITEHNLSMSDLESTMRTNFAVGLTSDEAASRLLRDGPNSLTPPKKPPMWYKLFMHLAGGFSLLLWAGSVLCFIVYGIDGSIENLTLGTVLAVVVVMTGLFSFYQELKSEKVLEGFLKMTPTTCEVLRDGKFMLVYVILL
jgi:sodium/potassium-transporting ATPase subunit alpha